MTAAFADDDLFHVLVSDDDMKRMNVDQLADAFRLSVIDASTLVWQTGMNGWRRLGSIADVEPEAEEELETAVLWAAPPPPPPVPAPRRRTTAAYQTTAPYRATVPQAPVYQAPAPVHSPASYFERPAYQQAAPAYQPAPTYPAEPEPYYAQASYQAAAEPFAQPELMSPVYSPAMPEPDPYVLPKRRVDIPEKIDFRRAPGSIRWGRWFVALLVMTGGVVGAYRQNLLRDGARGIGIESTYLAAEHRTTAFVSAKSSPGVKRVLERLALLPGPNAQADAAPEPTSPASSPAAAPILLGAAPAVAAPPCVAQPVAPQKVSEIKPTSDAEVRTVSLNALPLLGKASSAKPAAAERAEPREPAVTRARKSAPAKAEADEEENSAPARPSKKKARAERREASEEPEEKPVAKAKKEKREPSKPKASALPPPPTDGNPLKAAMWSTVASDTKKLAARKPRD